MIEIFRDKYRILIYLRKIGFLTCYQKTNDRIMLNSKKLLRIFWYVFFIVSPMLIFSWVQYIKSQQLIVPNPSYDIQSKLLYYHEHEKDFNVIFVGDSRTYTNLHPHILDPLLEIKSFNLASFAHWFPTQLSAIRDLVRKMKNKNVVVVWSIGHLNFRPIEIQNNQPVVQIQNVYPMGIFNAVQYWVWGFPLKELLNNVIYYNPFTQCVSRRDQFRKIALQWANSSIFPNLLQKDDMDDFSALKEKQEVLQKKYMDNFVNQVQVLTDGDLITSVALHSKQGSYFRIELDPLYFRVKQNQVVDRYNDAITVDLRYWKIFTEILKIFKDAKIKVIVNEFEEAPYRYTSKEARQKMRNFMDEKVKNYVERQGFSYVRVNFDTLTDEDYFDFNHFNSLGVEKFNLLFAEAICPYLD